VLAVAAYESASVSDYQRAKAFCTLALQRESERPAEHRDPLVEVDVASVEALILLAEGAFPDTVAAYWRAAELAGAGRYAGLSAIYLGYGVVAGMLGGVDVPDVRARAQSAVTLARKSGMPGAIVLSLAALAMTLVVEQPGRAGQLLQESIDRSNTPDGEISQSFIVACMVAGRLRDWPLTLRLVAHSMSVWRWNMVATLQAAPFLALSARALAENRPDLAGVLHGAAIRTFRRESAGAGPTPDDQAPFEANVTLMSTALAEARDLVVAAIGDEQQRLLYATGTAMTTDEAISYALANIDEKLLTGADQRDPRP